MNYNMIFLVVDDMDGMRRIVVRNLHQMGLKNVVTANNGADAWRMIQSQPIDAVITDWNMPVMSGLSLLKTIRASPQFGTLPVLMMTAETERHQVKVAIEAGASDFIIKPFSANSLETKLKNVIRTPLPAEADSARPGRTKVPSATGPSAISEPPAIILSEEFKSRLAREATLLAVDDMSDNLDVLVELLGDEYLVKAANSGERALKILASGKLPDLILLDVMMPGMDGFEVCRRIKANPATADIPVIFLTAMSEVTDVTRGFELGAVDFVTKPADPPILKARIRTHLRLKRSLEEVKRSHAALVEQHAVLGDNLRLRDEVERISQHDMKNPIGGIISFASMLRDDETLNPDHKEMISYIEQSAYSVLNMVNLSLDLYKMEQGSYEFNPNSIDLSQLLNRIVKEKTSELSSRKVRIQFMNEGIVGEPASGLQALGDELLCYSMFSNLFKNAMEAAGANTVIQINLLAAADQITVLITNDGAVPVDIRDSFFDKFTTSGKKGGTGLGTFSAQLIARTQGGDIAMDVSDENRTTTISVTLPGPSANASE